MHPNSRKALIQFIVFIMTFWIFFLCMGIMIILAEDNILRTEWNTLSW